MSLLTLIYDKNNGVYTYSFSENAPPNCNTIEYSSFADIELSGRYVLFIGSIWTGNLDVIIASILGDIAYKHPHVKFYFRIIVEETEIEKLVPKEVVFSHLPIVLFIEGTKITTISTGTINKNDLGNKIEQISGSIPK